MLSPCKTRFDLVLNHPHILTDPSPGPSPGPSPDTLTLTLALAVVLSPCPYPHQYWHPAAHNFHPAVQIAVKGPVASCFLFHPPICFSFIPPYVEYTPICISSRLLCDPLIPYLAFYGIPYLVLLHFSFHRIVSRLTALYLISSHCVSFRQFIAV